MIKNIEHNFLVAGLIFMIAGLFIGLWMGITETFTMISIHSHLGLIGWASMGLYAVVYRLELAIKDKWAVIHFYISISGLILFTIGLYIEYHINGNVIAIATGAVLTILSFFIFLINVLRARKINRKE